MKIPPRYLWYVMLRRSGSERDRGKGDSVSLEKIRFEVDSHGHVC